MAKFYKIKDKDEVIALLEGSGESLKNVALFEELIPGSVEASLEKHIPYIEKKEDGKIYVQVGSEKHPMLEKHYIGFVAAEGDGFLKIKYLKAGDDPSVTFSNRKGNIKRVYAYCNIHGLWVKNLD